MKTLLFGLGLVLAMPAHADRGIVAPSVLFGMVESVAVNSIQIDQKVYSITRRTVKGDTPGDISEARTDSGMVFKKGDEVVFNTQSTESDELKYIYRLAN